MILGIGIPRWSNILTMKPTPHSLAKYEHIFNEWTLRKEKKSHFSLFFSIRLDYLIFLYQGASTSARITHLKCRWLRMCSIWIQFLRFNYKSGETCFYCWRVQLSKKFWQQLVRFRLTVKFFNFIRIYRWLLTMKNCDSTKPTQQW